MTSIITPSYLYPFLNLMCNFHGGGMAKGAGDKRQAETVVNCPSDDNLQELSKFQDS